MDKIHPPTAIFLRSDLDDYGLNPYEFRLLAHISRRGVCYAKLSTIAKACKMSQKKAQDGLKVLVQCGLLYKEKQGTNKPSLYKVVHDSDFWKSRYKLDEIRASIQPPSRQVTKTRHTIGDKPNEDDIKGGIA